MTRPRLPTGHSAAAAILLATMAIAGGMVDGDLDSVRLLLEKGRYVEAEAAARSLLVKVEGASGRDSLEAAGVLDLVVEAALSIGKSEDPETRVLAERALSIKEKVLGPDHPEFAKSLTNLGFVLQTMGDLGGARELLERALAIREKALGPRHPETAASLDAIADVLQTTVDYQRARELYERSLAIKEESLGPGHPDVARTLNGLAIMLLDLGDLDGAKARYERALAIRVQALGPEHPLSVKLLNNLAVLLVEMGDYAGALPLHEQTLDLWTKSLGPEHPAVGAASFNLANLYAQMGDYGSARPLYDRALMIWDQAHGPGHPRVPRVLNELGLMLLETGDFAGARPLLERALATMGQTPGAEDLLVADVLSNLGSVARLSGDSARAGRLFERALTIRRRILDPGNPQVAETLREIARLSIERGRHEEARSLYQQCLAIQETALGPTHPVLAGTLTGLAEALRLTGDGAGALQAGLRGEQIGREHFRLTARTLAERGALRFASVRGSGLDTALSLAANGLDPDSRRQVWDALLRSRALVLDEMASRHSTATRADDPALDALIRALASARTRLANLTLRGLEADEDLARYRRILEAARDSKERAEKALAEKSLAFRRDQGPSRIGYAEVRDALPPGAVLIAYALYRSGSRSSYLALVMRADETGPAVVPLGPAGRIDEIVRRWRQEAGSAPRADRTAAAQDESRFLGKADAVKRAVWDPLAPHIRDARVVFVVPDGSLHLLNMATLPGSGNTYQIESGPTVHYLSTERDLVPRPASGLPAGTLLALGNPAFDDNPPPAPPARRPFRGEHSGCGGFLSMRFEPLPSAKREIQQIASLWREVAGTGLYLTGRHASEAAFKRNAPGRSVLHLATHGFFLGDRCPSALEPSRGIGGIASANPTAPPLTGENPLLLSGLALAGANHRRAAGPDAEDGILTAEEIAALDLADVEWAVLSACDTGAGEVQAGEGVFGLRRAFQVAGARTVIMSLWSVEDESARQWMQALYEGRLLKGLSTAEAVREASLSLLRTRREKGASAHPFYWGAFVAAGDWR